MSASAAAAAALVLAAAAAGQRPDDPLRVDGRRPDLVVVTRGESWDDSLPLDTTMGRMAAGVYARYRGAAVGRLLGCATRKPLPAGAVDGSRRIALLHLSLGDRGASRIVELLGVAGGIAARPLDADDGVVVRLDAARFAPLTERWPAYRGGLEPPDPGVLGISAPLARPYVAGAVTMDAPTMKQRLYRGMPVRAPGADRRLDLETLHARLPAGYDPRHPAGLLVWCSPTAGGSIPHPLATALDELGLVCVAAENAGNDRDVPDKFQLAFDAVATARERFHIDDKRVYIAGMSGGGKVASILGLCFPEIFSGAVPIVGFATYTALDESWGRHRAAYFARPREPALALGRRRRIALVGGPGDFNYAEMTERAARLEADGFEHVRFFAYPDMAHEMPTPARFAEALGWVDEPYRQRRDERIARARALLAAYLNDRDDPHARTDEDRTPLRHVIETAPWSDPAWRALAFSRRTTR